MLYPVIDMHCDTASMLRLSSLEPEVIEQLGIPASFIPGRDADVVHNAFHVSVEKIGEGAWLQCYACFMPDSLPGEQAVAFWQSVSTFLDNQVEIYPHKLSAVRSGKDMHVAIEAGKVGVIKTLENALLFAQDLSLVHQCAQAGVVMASLSWNGAGPLASGHDDESAGLSALGRDAVRLMGEEGIVLDVSHLNDMCFAEVERLSTRPFVASHSNARTVCGHPRNLTDGQFGVIRDRGGVVGLNFERTFLSDDPDAAGDGFDIMCAHIEHWLDLGGERVIALGSDFDGCTPFACVADAAHMGDFQERLTERFGADLTARLCYKNALAFFESWA